MTQDNLKCVGNTSISAALLPSREYRFDVCLSATGRARVGEKYSRKRGKEAKGKKKFRAIRGVGSVMEKSPLFCPGYGIADEICSGVQLIDVTGCCFINPET